MDLSSNSDWLDKKPTFKAGTFKFNPGMRQKPLSFSLGSMKLEDKVEREKQPQKNILERNSHLALALMNYLVAFFMIILVSVPTLLIVQFGLAIYNDICIKIEEETIQIMNEISECSAKYVENRCLPSERVPAMDKLCRTWEVCMNRDPAVVGTGRLSAKTFGEIFNSFIEPISLKTMLFLFLCLLGIMFVVRYSFSFLRSPNREIEMHNRVILFDFSE